MNEHDGHEMLVARCKALEKIASKLIGDASANTGYLLTPEKIKKQLEVAVEHEAPGCSHSVK
jgi:hypothetical protein